MIYKHVKTLLTINFKIMSKYKFLRDRVANGFVLNTTPAPDGWAAPRTLSLVKRFKKGDVVDGVVSGNSITISVTDAKQTSGQPYSGTVDLVSIISEGNNIWMENINTEIPKPIKVDYDKINAEKDKEIANRNLYQKYKNWEDNFIGEQSFIPSGKGLLVLSIKAALIITVAVVVVKYVRKKINKTK